LKYWTGSGWRAYDLAQIEGFRTGEGCTVGEREEAFALEVKRGG